MSDDGARLEELAHDVLGPLVCGGTILPVRPVGPRLAAQFAQERTIVDDDLRTRVDVIRVRIARQLTAVDTLPDISPTEWALVAGWNDLVQVTNHELSGALTRGRHLRLLQMVQELVDAVPTCRSPLEALCRHSVLSRVLEAFRTDSSLRWWTGSASFRGRPISKRLSAWPELRKVQVDKTRVPLVKMLDGIGGVPAVAFLAAVRSLLARTPLTDLATASRSSPDFVWSADTVALVTSPLGRTLAARAIARGEDPRRARTVLANATQGLDDAFPQRPACEALLEELAPRDAEAARSR